ncbi:MAG: 50S ribosomal protein L18 [Puniceicoccales bacterium]|jgi:large subunit ribosomal protein L18|nr:50S ribosomal protein L18 [Puniceicoccales bacterium]
MQIDKKTRSEKRKKRVRKCISGTAARPRLSVRFSGKHIYAQCVNDEVGRTLVFLSTLTKEAKEKKAIANVAGATFLGKVFGEKAMSCGIKQVVFDRGGRRYHGCVQSFADAARGAGLLF